MSATFKNAKKKQIQNELRRYMSEHKSKHEKEGKKIDSPLAKYNESGQLTCILCKSIVRSESVWNVHINAKQHRQNVELAKKLKERTNNFTVPLKRPLTPPLEVPEKKLKGILKNKIESEPEPNETGIPPIATQTPMEVEVETSETIPEGFFDDPKQDAKARNQEYKNPIEEEWEKFQREIREADSQSAAIIAEDQEEATNERQIEEIDEQLKILSKVVDLAKKKVDLIPSVSENRDVKEASDEEDMDEDIDEFLDWRDKKSFK